MYVVVVLGGGLLLGHTDSPQIGLSVLATAIVALGFEPVRLGSSAWRPARLRARPSRAVRRAERVLRVAHRARTTGRSELPLRMARLLAEGTGAAWAEVWLVVGDEPEPAAVWPPAAGGLRAAGSTRRQPGAAMRST